MITSDLKGAGTDANVSISLVGEAGETGVTALAANYDTFERAQVHYGGTKGGAASCSWGYIIGELRVDSLGLCQCVCASLPPLEGGRVPAPVARRGPPRLPHRQA